MPRRHPEQLTVPGTAPPVGPCDAARDAYVTAIADATEAADARRRSRDQLIDRMQETGVSRVPYVDPKSGKRKWLEITADPKLRSVKAEDGEQVTARGRRVLVEVQHGPAVESVADGLQRVGELARDLAAGAAERDAADDPFAATRVALSEETPAQRSVREAEEARAGRRKAGAR